MLNSNIFSMIITAFMALTFTGCTLPKPQNRDTGNSTASFLIEGTEVSRTEQREIKGFSIPAAKTFHFKACIRDLKQSRPILNHDFAIQGDGKEFMKTTDSNGCLNWNEEIVYNHFAEAKFIPLERTIEAHGLQKGARLLRWGINPWENQAYDLDKTEVQNLVTKELAAQTLMSSDKQQRTIVANDVQLNFLEKQNSSVDGLAMTMELRATPNIEIRKSSNEVSYESLAEGRFRVRMNILHTVVEGKTEIRKKVFSSDLVTASTLRGQLSVKVPLVMQEICTRGQYQLGLELEADLPPPYQLKKFEGLYFISECNQMKGNFYARLSNEYYASGGDFSLAKYLSQTLMLDTGSGASATSDPKVPLAEGSQKAGYFFSELQASVVNFKGAQALQQRIGLRMKICLSSTFDQRVPSGYKFDLIKVNGQKTELTTQVDGCLSWEDSLEYKILDKECEQRAQVVISSPKLNLSETIPMMINPRAGQVRDLHINKELANAIAQCADGNASIFMSSFNFLKSRFEYEIDPFMDLVIKKQGLLGINFSIKRPTLVADLSGSELIDAPIGSYLLQVALVKNTANIDALQGSDILSFQEQNAKVESRGVLVQNISFNVTDLKEVGSTARILVSILPADTTSNVQSNIFSGYYSLGDNLGNGRLEILSSYSGQSFMNNVKILQQSEQKKRSDYLLNASSKNTLQKDLHLSLMNLNKPAETEELRYFSRADLSALTYLVSSEQLTPSLADKFCTYWYKDFFHRPLPRTGEGLLSGALMAQVEYLNCQRQVQKNPEQYFDVQTRSFINHPKITQIKEGFFRDFTVSNSFNLSRSRSQSYTTSNTLDVGAGVDVGAKFANAFGVSASAGYHHTWTWSDSDAKTQGSSVGFSSSVTLAVEMLSLRVQTDSVEKCVIVKIKPEIFAAKKLGVLGFHFNSNLTADEKALAMLHGLVLCEGEAQQKNQEFVENYYLINQNLYAGQMLDINSSKNRPFFAAVRGDSDFVGFISLLQQNHQIPDSFRSDFQNRQFIKDRTKAYFLKNLPGSPGQIIHAR